MNLKSEILREHSKVQMEWIAAQIGDCVGEFDQVMALVFGDDEVMARRASWVMSCCVEAHPQLMTQPYLEKLVELLLTQESHPAIRRHITKILQTYPLPDDDLTAKLFEACCKLLNDPDEPVASRAHSMTILKRICERHPVLADEVQLLIEDAIPHGSTGFKSRGRKTLNELEKISGKNLTISQGPTGD